MTTKFLARTSLTLNAPAKNVWEALTKPELVKQYFFGTNVSTDWQVGSPIIYQGEWQGKTYEDKGTVLQNEPYKLLVSTFWSSLSGKPDLPENYQTVRYELTAAESNKTVLTVIQDNNETQAAATHSEQNWNVILEGMKKLLEG